MKKYFNSQPELYRKTDAAVMRIQALAHALEARGIAFPIVLKPHLRLVAIDGELLADEEA